jgi:hypothetical protein
MTPAEILDTSLGVYQNMGWTLLRVCAVPSLMCLAALLFTFDYVIPAIQYTDNPANVDAQLIEALVTLLLGVGVGGSLFFFGIAYAGALTTQIVADYVSGSMPNLDAAKRAARRNLWRVAMLSFRQCMWAFAGLILSALALMASAWIATHRSDSFAPVYITGFGIIAMVVGLILLPVIVTTHALAVPTCVNEGLAVTRALRRGRTLLKAAPPYQPSGYDTIWALILLAGLLLLFILGGIEGAMHLAGAQNWVARLHWSVPFRPVIAGALAYLAPYLAIWTILPVWCTTTTILYFERRIRLEGYDIESLAKDIWRADKHRRFEL